MDEMETLLELRDDVMFALECCTDEKTLGCNVCPYNTGCPDCSRNLMKDVLKLMENDCKKD